MYMPQKQKLKQVIVSTASVWVMWQSAFHKMQVYSMQIVKKTSVAFELIYNLNMQPAPCALLALQQLFL